MSLNPFTNRRKKQEEAVEEKLDAFEADVAEEKATAMAAAMADDSSDEEGG